MAAPGPGEVWFYQHGNYGGKCWKFTSSQRSMGGANDEISSIKVGPGVTVQIFKDSQFRGDTVTISSNTPSMPKGWNDKLSSFRIVGTPDPRAPDPKPSSGPDFGDIFGGLAKAALTQGVQAIQQHQAARQAVQRDVPNPPPRPPNMADRLDADNNPHPSTLAQGQEIRSLNGAYQLVMQPDGNLVLNTLSASAAPKLVWSTNTAGRGRPPFSLVAQPDGNAVIYDGGRAAIWSTNTGGQGNGRDVALILQNDRNLALFANTKSIWSSKTTVSSSRAAGGPTLFDQLIKVAIPLLQSIIFAPPGQDQVYNTPAYTNVVNTTTAQGPPTVAPPGQRRKAVLMGLNYPGSSAPLRGCYNDVENMRRLITAVGWKDEDCLILLDRSDSKNQPTQKGMLAALKWLVEGSAPGDHLVWHYSGHGGQSRDARDPTGQSNCIYPSDFKSGATLLDKELHNLLAQNLVDGVVLTVILDCCHSGTALDLPYMQQAAASDSQHTYAELQMPNNAPIKGAVTLISGCRDDQTSADTVMNGSPCGALTFALVNAIQQAKLDITYKRLLYELKSNLAKQHSIVQTPQFSYNMKDFDIDGKFSF